MKGAYKITKVRQRSIIFNFPSVLITKKMIRLVIRSNCEISKFQNLKIVSLKFYDWNELLAVLYFSFFCFLYNCWFLVPLFVLGSEQHSSDLFVLSSEGGSFRQMTSGALPSPTARLRYRNPRIISTPNNEMQDAPLQSARGEKS